MMIYVNSVKIIAREMPVPLVDTPVQLSLLKPFVSKKTIFFK